MIVDNPQPNSALDSIEFEYVEFGDIGAASGWLGGPLAVSLVTSEPELESTFTYRGEFLSSLATVSAVSAGTHAIWYELQFTASIPSGSEILVHLTCGDDDSPANSTLDAGGARGRADLRPFGDRVAVHPPDPVQRPVPAVSGRDHR